jgi:hypothetical protein
MEGGGGGVETKKTEGEAERMTECCHLGIPLSGITSLTIDSLISEFFI